MEKLNYKVLEQSDYTGYILKDAPEKVLQFGTGTFLRAFSDEWFDRANETVGWNGKCVVVQSTSSSAAEKFARQEGLYTMYLRGFQNGEQVDEKRVISVISRCLRADRDYDAIMEVAVSDDLEYVLSNTTEAGIVYDSTCGKDDRPPASFPAKLTQVLYARQQAGKGGLVILSCELIDNNGKELQRCVEQYADQWALGEDFKKWLREECLFCSTLVDRIVTGNIRDKEEVARLEAVNGYEDDLLDVGEVYGEWYVEGPAWLEEKMPFKAAGVNCFVVPDVTPYKKRKVRILNGAHTGFVPGAYLAGFDIVRDCMHDEVILNFMNKMLYEEIVPILPLDKEDCLRFASATYDRFNNPFVDHQLINITLNSTSKWRARNLPSLLEHLETFGKLPPCLAMGLAGYIALYSNDIQALTDEGLVCKRPAGDTYVLRDDRWALEFFYARRESSVEELVHAVMTNLQMWGQDLTEIPGFEAVTVENVKRIREQGAKAAFAACL